MTAKLTVGLVLAAAAWAAMFAVRQGRFWTRALLAGLAIGVYAVVVDGSSLRRLLTSSRWPVEVAIGTAGAVVLYGVFWTGEQLLAWALPVLSRQVGELYQIRGQTRARNIPLILLVIGPAEELFWRGFVQFRAGLALALIGYAAVHIWERKAVLVLAAAVGGAFWGGLFAWRGDLIAPVVSHALWDLAVVVWFPIRPVGRLTARARRRHPT
jgi:membrane protease YdiL (CAAX protease family)